MKIAVFLSFVALLGTCFTGCSNPRNKGTMADYVNKRGLPDLVAESIVVQTQHKGVKVVVIERLMNRITNQTDILNPACFLYTPNSDLKFAIDNFYKNINSVEMSVKLQRLFPVSRGVEVTIVETDNAGTIRTLRSGLIDEVSVPNRPVKQRLPSQDKAFGQ